MKRILVLGVALMLVVAMGSVAMAAYDSNKLDISAGVATFGEIRDWPETLDLGTLSGESGDWIEAETGEFKIVRNDKLLVTLQITKPLMQRFYYLDGEGIRVYEDFEVGTTVTLQEEALKWAFVFPYLEWEDQITVSAGPNVDQYPVGSFITSGFGSYRFASLFDSGFRLKAKAVLGDVDDQPAGDYEGEVVLTISAPLS